MNGPILTLSVAVARRVHLMGPCDGPDEAHDAMGNFRSRWTDPVLAGGRTGIKAVHFIESQTPDHRNRRIES